MLLNLYLNHPPLQNLFEANDIIGPKSCNLTLLIVAIHAVVENARIDPGILRVVWLKVFMLYLIYDLALLNQVYAAIVINFAMLVTFAEFIKLTEQDGTSGLLRQSE